MSYSVKPEDMEEKFGYLWPDGAPVGLCEADIECRMEFVDKDGEHFVIVYTLGQMQAQVAKHGWFSPYAPMYVSDLRDAVKESSTDKE